jgi:hypothetical protein
MGLKLHVQQALLLHVIWRTIQHVQVQTEEVYTSDLSARKCSYGVGFVSSAARDSAPCQSSERVDVPRRG